MTAWWLALAAGFALALPLTAVARPLARRLGQLDRPGAHKLHARPVPVAGGVAVLAAVALPLGVALAAAAGGRAAALLPAGLAADLERQAPQLAVLLAGALLLHFVGLVDDRVGLGPPVKLLAQAAAALPLVVAFDLRLLPLWLTPAAGVALTVLWFVVVINAFNFLDGLDGLLGGVAAICAVLLGLTALATGHLVTAALLAVLAGALGGFLVFNLPPASIYLGDAGSLVVGHLLAYASIAITYRDPDAPLEAPWYAVFVPLVVLAIPLYDFVTVIALRLAERRDPTRADTNHFPHRLLRRGMAPRRALAVIWACTLATGMGGVMLIHLEAWQAVLVAAQTAAVLLVLALLEDVRFRARR